MAAEISPRKSRGRAGKSKKLDRTGTSKYLETPEGQALDEKHQKNLIDLAAGRTNLEAKLNAHVLESLKLRRELSLMDEGSLDYKRKLLELDDQDKRVMLDKQQITEETNRMQNQYNRLHEELVGRAIRSGGTVNMPTGGGGYWEKSPGPFAGMPQAFANTKAPFAGMPQAFQHWVPDKSKQTDHMAEVSKQTQATSAAITQLLGLATSQGIKINIPTN